MKFDAPLKEGVLLRRYKRFFADVDFDGTTLVTHVANTGSLLGVLSPEPTKCKFTLSDDPKRKLKASLQMIQTPTSWVGINTQIPNRIVLEAFEAKLVPHWQQFEKAKPEFKLNKESRLDLALYRKHDDQNPSHYIEIKNVTLAKDGTALFPDAVTERGAKHLDELSHLLDVGNTCEMVFVIQRTDCKKFDIAKDIDPNYFAAVKKALKKGLKVSAYPVKFVSDRVELDTENPLEVYF